MKITSLHVPTAVALMRAFEQALNVPMPSNPGWIPLLQSFVDELKGQGYQIEHAWERPTTQPSMTVPMGRYLTCGQGTLRVAVFVPNHGWQSQGRPMPEPTWIRRITPPEES